MGDIRRMFNPQAIALIGATDKEKSIGRTIVENLSRFQDRKVFLVNPNRESVAGLHCYRDVTDVPEHLDLVIVATPAPTVPDVVRSCGKAGVDGVVIISAGFREVGDAGRKLEEELLDIRRRYGVRILGPNCIGFMRPNIGLNASFLTPDAEPGNIAFISQSGQLGDAIMDWGRHAHIGFSMFASLGSMLDIDFGDLIDFLGDDYETRSIMLYMENVGSAKRFLSAARGFARNKPIVVLKPGVFEESVEAVLSHTGAMAGNDKAYDAAFKRVGLVRVKEVTDLFNTAAVLDSHYLPKGPRLAIVTNAGGVGIIATDTLLSLGGELARLTDESIEALNGVLPGHWSKANPVDILGDADTDRYANAIPVCVKDPNVDGILVVHAPRAIADPVELAKVVVDIAKKTPKPIICTRMGGRAIKEGVEYLLRNDVPTYDTPEEAVRTYMYMYKYKRNLDLLYETPTELGLGQASPKNHLKALIRKALRQNARILDAEESASFLPTYGIPVAKTFVTQNANEAARKAGKIGYPVVLKISSPEIPHKTDVGGVMPGITSEAALREAFSLLSQKAKEIMPEGKSAAITVQKMVGPIDYEIMLGAKRDRDFGSVILFGMGGVGAEIFQDFSVGLPPLNQTLARRLMEETKVYTMLKGYRGKAPADLRQLEEVIVSFSNLIVDFPEIVEMDINPIAIVNGRTSALDVRVVIDGNAQAGGSPSYPHLAITPYPARYITPWRLPDGTEVLLRPIRPEDEPLEREMLTTLSEQTLRERFFSVIKDITHEMLIRFCNIDYDREMAIVAEIRQGDKRRIVGIGRLIIETDLVSGQFAALVHDDFHGKGLGYTLIDLMIGIAQEKGLEEIYGIVLNENDRMLNVCRKLGFTVRLLPDGITRVTLPLK